MIMSDDGLGASDDTPGADNQQPGVRSNQETSATSDGGIVIETRLAEAAQNGGSPSGQHGDGGEKKEEASSEEDRENSTVIHEDTSKGPATEGDGREPDPGVRTNAQKPDDPILASEASAEGAQEDPVAPATEEGEPEARVASEASSSQEEQSQASDPLSAALQTLFRNVSHFVQAELQLAHNEYNLLERMNLRAAQEYDEHGDFAAGLRVFVEQVKEKHDSFRGYLQQIDEIDREVTHLEAVVSTLDNYSSVLYSKVMAAYGDQRPL